MFEKQKFKFSADAAHLRSVNPKIYVGGALDPNVLQSENGYRTVAAEELNCLTPENAMKWDGVENNRGQMTYSGGDQLVAFAQQHDMKVRGHCLIWHGALPGWVNSLSKSDLENAMKKHITEEVTHYKGKIYAWDVVNEAIGDDGNMRDMIWYKNFGNNFIAEAFRLAHAADPNAKLYYNDYNIEGKNHKSDAMYKLVQDLKNEGVLIHGVGFQSHFTLGQVPNDMQQNMERFAALGLDVAITELDIKIELPSTPQKLAQQAQDYASVVKAFHAVSRCVGVTFWGISDKRSWVPSVFHGSGDALPWDVNYHPKPAVAAMEAALK